MTTPSPLKEIPVMYSLYTRVIVFEPKSPVGMSVWDDNEGIQIITNYIEAVSNQRVLRNELHTIFFSYHYLLMPRVVGDFI